MGIEDVTANASGVITTFNRSTLGARGVDMVSTSIVNDGTYVSYPIYDAHGNNVGAVSKNGSGFHD